MGPTFGLLFTQQSKWNDEAEMGMVLHSLTEPEKCFFSKCHSLREAWEQFHRNPCPGNPQNLI